MTAEQSNPTITLSKTGNDKMITFKMRTEQEMMQELALVAVKEHTGFIIDGSQYSLPNGLAQTSVYDMVFLNIRFVEDGHKDCVIKFTSTLVPFAPAFYYPN